MNNSFEQQFQPTVQDWLKSSAVGRLQETHIAEICFRWAQTIKVGGIMRLSQLPSYTDGEIVFNIM